MDEVGLGGFGAIIFGFLCTERGSCAHARARARLSGSVDKVLEGVMSLYPRKLRREIVRFAVRNYELRTAETVMETLSGAILTGWGANVTGI